MHNFLISSNIKIKVALLMIVKQNFLQTLCYIPCISSSQLKVIMLPAVNTEPSMETLLNYTRGMHSLTVGILLASSTYAITEQG